MFIKGCLLFFSLTCELVNSSYWWLDDGTFSQKGGQVQKEERLVQPKEPVQHVDLVHQSNLIVNNPFIQPQELVQNDGLYQNGNAVQDDTYPDIEEVRIDLPMTECPNPTTCASKDNCQGTNYEKEQLIPCMVQSTRQFGVCCSELANAEVFQPQASEQLQQSSQQLNNFQVESNQPTQTQVRGNSCPVITKIQSFTECRGQQSNCWSVGVPDLDCKENSLCCFDGCVNVCLGNGPVIEQNQVVGSNNQPLVLDKNTNIGKIPIIEKGFQAEGSQIANIIIPNSQRMVNRKPQGYGVFTGSNGSPVQIINDQTDRLEQPTFLFDDQQLSYSNPVYTEPTETTNNGFTYSENTITTNTNQYQETEYRPVEETQPTLNTNQHHSVLPVQTVNDQSKDIKYKPIVFPGYNSNPSAFNNLPVSSAGQQYTQETETLEYQPQRSQPTQFDLISTTLSSISTQQDSTLTPWVLCPSAMKCVPRQNCDLTGVMVERALNLSPELEKLRGPLIPCVNQQKGNMIDVCCRDPNYKDSWPNMNGNGEQQKEIVLEGSSSSQVISSQLTQGPRVLTITQQRRRGSNGYGK